jgi:hypothetical protein
MDFSMIRMQSRRMIMITPEAGATALPLRRLFCFSAAKALDSPQQQVVPDS